MVEFDRRDDRYISDCVTIENVKPEDEINRIAPDLKTYAFGYSVAYLRRCGS